MSSCLGIYIEKNIIKYAKVSKDKEKIKVEAFGIKIYTDIDETVKQIVSETFSQKVPISINISDEVYNYFFMSALLNKKDLEKAIATEFESMYYEKKDNPNAVISKFILTPEIDNKDTIKVIHASVDKVKINLTLQKLENQMVQQVTPISMSIANIVPISQKENSVIVNIENSTTFTTLIGGIIYDIQKIPEGSSLILDTINKKENSYMRAYEICKNTTIYTLEEDTNNTGKENQYLEDIIPVLFSISQKIIDITKSSIAKINKVYITGLASVINNIDLYFSELIPGIKCEILKPYFLEDTQKINIKDYIEVNSAIALALQGLNGGIKNINFNENNTWKNLKKLLTSDIGSSKKRTSFTKPKIKIPTGKIMGWFNRTLSGTIVLMITYISIATYINFEIKSKNEAIEKVNSDIQKQIELIDSDKSKVDNKSSEYKTLTSNLQKATDEINTKNSYKNVMPVLLSEIMNVIPTEVQLTSIENPSDKKIIINAQSRKYEQLAIFKALLRSEGILEPTSVVSTEAVKSDGFVKTVIEGELP